MAKGTSKRTRKLLPNLYSGMNDREKARKIVAAMAERGVAYAEWEDVSLWTEQEVDYFVVNYGPYYLED